MPKDKQKYMLYHETITFHRTPSQDKMAIATKMGWNIPTFLFVNT